ncbi:Ger(x)C family spore germination protein [Clostridiisalibacter paucivorans]|uniref:Ger(x)C family spore germination protein n=1 Tax=Clostridiisalibacter paucivorans TaxID=408753 RepID=UPI0004792A92|nr:Ger(x)C family spore germination protein [Clostridiisalibacter paucivorans]
MKKLVIKIILICILSIFVCGCWNYKDLNKKSVSLSIGVDYYENTNEIQFINEVAELTTKSTEEVEITGVNLYEAQGENFEKARNDIDRQEPSLDFAGATRVLVFSRRYAEDGIKSYINRVDRLYGLRSSALVAISDKSPKEIFSNKVKNNISVGHSIEDTIRYLSENGMSIYVTSYSIENNMAIEEIGYVIPYITVEKSTSKYLGLGIIKDSKLIDVVNADEAKGILFLMIPDAVTVDVFNYSNNKASIRTKVKDKKIKTDYSKGKVNINIDLKMDSNIQYLYKDEKITKEEIEKLEKQATEKIKEHIMKQINRSKEEYKCDFYGFAKYFNAQNPEIYRELDWKTEYPRSDIKINIDLKIVGTNIIEVLK